jgi:hypothetical protein
MNLSGWLMLGALPRQLMSTDQCRMAVAHAEFIEDGLDVGLHSRSFQCHDGGDLWVCLPRSQPPQNLRLLLAQTRSFKDRRIRCRLLQAAEILRQEIYLPNAGNPCSMPGGMGSNTTSKCRVCVFNCPKLTKSQPITSRRISDALARNEPGVSPGANNETRCSAMASGEIMNQSPVRPHSDPSQE